MPCAGKTYWGSRVASAYGWSFTDLDEYIEKEQGRSIEAIFTEDGEHVFRHIEHNALIKLISNSTSNTVIASGGGTSAFYNNTTLMKNAGCVVYLKPALQLIIERLKATESKRPLFAKKNLEDVVQKLYTERVSFYEQADYILDTDSISILNFEEIITSCINRQ
jgi:shikimate kinase